MKAIGEVSAALAAQQQRLGTPKLRLAEASGITAKTLAHALSGDQDFKVSTLLAVADRLGLELLLVPRAASAGLPGPAESAQVLTRVQAALNEVGRGGR